jgi:hypothetical protein
VFKTLVDDYRGLYYQNISGDFFIIQFPGKKRIFDPQLVTIPGRIADGPALRPPSEPKVLVTDVTQNRQNKNGTENSTRTIGTNRKPIGNQ